MTSREKRLVILSAGGVAAVLAAWLLVDAAVVGPVGRYRAQSDALRKQIADCNRNIAMERVYRSRLENYKARTFAGDPEKASEEIRQWVAGRLAKTELDRGRYQLLPASGSGHRGVFAVAGRGLSASGPLGKAVDLVYLMLADGHVGRVDSLRVAPADNWKTPQVALTLTYLSPVLVDRTGKPVPVTPDAAKAAPADPAAPERRGYDAIADRDLLRPFRKYVPPEEKPVARRTRPERRTPAAEPATPPAIVTGLPRMGRLGPEVIVTDSSGEETCLKVGDPLAGGTIVMVDYRPLPTGPGRQDVSTSRVIVRIDAAYWAIELGRNVDSKRRLTESQWPPELTPAPVPEGPASRPRP